MGHKSGFVNIIGNPNVGKSTLMNVLVGEKISVITSKAQTTRHRIMGIINTDDYQIVYSDTPDIIKPHYKMHEAMMSFVKKAIEDADIILYVTDVKETLDKNQEYIDRINRLDIPVIVIINKIDMVGSNEELDTLTALWESTMPKAKIIPVSAIQKFNVVNVMHHIVEILPEAPPFFEKDALTDKPERFFVSEIIREKIFINYKKEVPYSTEVVIETFKEGENLIHIRAAIIVSRDSQKGIIIGKQGLMLKKIGTHARQDIEDFFGKKVFLEIFVKVEKDWRDKDRLLREFGYEN
jgi:GTP-binding protein Era